MCILPVVIVKIYLIIHNTNSTELTNTIGYDYILYSLIKKIFYIRLPTYSYSCSTSFN